jgi:hypothetical protein
MMCTTLNRNPPNWGGPLLEADYANLLSCWITREIADAVLLRRVDEHEGREVVCQKGKRDCAGILIPYLLARRDFTCELPHSS